MQCPVLRRCIRLRDARLPYTYAMPGTDLVYAATSPPPQSAHGVSTLQWDSAGTAAAISLRACYTMSGTGIAYGVISPYALAMRCPVLV
eukprot:2076372-Rhodomonas_salina.1